VGFGVAVVVLGDGGVLLVKREDVEAWTGPGGAVDEGGWLTRVAACEGAEETGVEVRLDCLVGLYSRPAAEPARGVCAGTRVGGRLDAQPGEAVDAAFFPPEALRNRCCGGSGARLPTRWPGRPAPCGRRTPSGRSTSTRRTTARVGYARVDS
jgi:ADP-ribose pyrophosphatase YjhB (NUDIX family)